MHPLWSVVQPTSLRVQTQEWTQQMWPGLLSPSVITRVLLSLLRSISQEILSASAPLLCLWMALIYLEMWHTVNSPSLSMVRGKALFCSYLEFMVLEFCYQWQFPLKVEMIWIEFFICINKSWETMTFPSRNHTVYHNVCNYMYVIFEMLRPFKTVGIISRYSRTSVLSATGYLDVSYLARSCRVHCLFVIHFHLKSCSEHKKAD